ncbi:MAG: hypothetical protein J0L79_00375 [Rickettsiales bacterium]|nr:hypothetical protein [Rickettsiales bacterium]MCA0254545.1 hypothetical protein [Pseudomonadota bacterium]
MGPEILAIAIVAGVLSLTSAGVSLGTFFHFKKKYSADSKNRVGIDIDQSSVDEELGDLHRHVTHKKVHFDQIDESSVKQTADFLRTGLPNEVASKLASNAGVLSSTLSPSSSLMGSHKVSESAPKKLVGSHEEKEHHHHHHHHRKHSDSDSKKKISEVDSNESLLDQIILLEGMDKSLSQHDGLVELIGHEGQY